MTVALDTSVAIPLVVETLPGDLRLAPTDALRIVASRFAEPRLLDLEVDPEVLLAHAGRGGRALPAPPDRLAVHRAHLPTSRAYDDGPEVPANDHPATRSSTRIRSASRKAGISAES